MTTLQKADKKVC